MFAVTPDAAETMALNGTEAFAKSGVVAMRQGGEVAFTITTSAGKPELPTVRLVDPATGVVLTDKVVVDWDWRRRRINITQGSFSSGFKARPPAKSPLGLIRFEVSWSDATGHFDVWNGAAAPPGGVPGGADSLDAIDTLSVPDGSTWSWSVGAYDPLVLDLVAAALADLPPSERTDPLRVARHLTQMGNNQVLRGRWDGEYKEGTEPWMWSSSTQIAATWKKQKQIVKYGQCWVFAGLTTTSLRSLGIPARTVTNLDAVSEKSAVGQADYLPGSDRCAGAEREKDPKTAPLWNFHVWVEMFMAEGDRTVAYAVDPTPNRDLTPAKLSDPVRVDELVKADDTGAF